MTIMKRRIAIIENSRGITGALRAIVATGKELNKIFDLVFILPAGSSGIAFVKAEGFFNVYEMPMRELSRRWSDVVFYIPILLLNAFRLRRIVEREKIDFIHNNDFFNLLPLSLLVVRSFRPYICHVRFLPDRFPSLLVALWLKLHLRFATNLVAVSKAVEHLLPKDAKIKQIYDPMPFEPFKDESIYPNDGIKRFLYVANFSPGKGHDTALKAFAFCKRRIPGWKLRFIGGDLSHSKGIQYANQLKLLSQELGISNLIEWGGFTKFVDKEYLKADIVLNFSESESLSLTCIEAMIFRKPVIATRCGGPEEIIRDKESGLLVRNRDYLHASEAMETLALSPELRERFSIAGHQFVVEHFSAKYTSGFLVSLFCNLERLTK